MKLLEKDVQLAVVQFARDKGCLAYKWSSMSSIGIPDYLFFYKKSLLLIEFKAPGKKITRFQYLVHEKLFGQGWQVTVIDDIQKGKDLVTSFITKRDQVL